MTEPARFSPLHRVHEELGASFTDFAGWQMPVRYDSDLAEHHAVRTAAGIFDISHMGEIAVTGEGASAFLNYALVGQFETLAIGQARYTLILNEAAGIIDDLIVYRLGEQRYLVVANAGNRDVVAEALQHRTSGFAVEVRDESDATAMLAVQGPNALAIVEKTVGLHLAAEAADRPESTLESLRYYWSLPAVFLGNPVLIARTGYTGEDGFELYIDAEHAEQLWVALSEAGQEHNLVPCGLACRDTLRLEAGMPLYGHELDLTTRPEQAGQQRVIAWNKGDDFVGKAALQHPLSADARVLVGLVGEGKRAPRADYDLYSGSVNIGTITSGALSPTLGYPVAMAYVDPSVAEKNTPLEVDVRGTRLPVTVTALPFYRRKK